MAIKNYEIRIAIDSTLLIAVLIIFLVLKEAAIPFSRGMHCNDESIKYPNHTFESISDSILIIYCVLIPIMLISVIEFTRSRTQSSYKRVTLCGRRLHSCALHIYSYVGLFLFGCACSQVTTMIGKITIGRLRPNFIEVCQPDWTKINCSATNYIDPVPCLTTDMDALNDARQSFPSGHASLSAFAMVYLTIYLQHRMKTHFSFLLKPVLQFGSLILAFYTSLTRVSDYKHHWSDVTGGFLLGSVIAILLEYFSKDEEEVSSEDYKPHDSQPLPTNVCDGREELNLDH